VISCSSQPLPSGSLNDAQEEYEEPSASRLTLLLECVPWGASTSLVLVGRPRLTRTLTHGAVAGLFGTVAMDALWYRRYRSAGGDGGVVVWEFGSHPSSWEEAPAPARAGRILAAKLLGYDVPIAHAGLLTNLMHWGYGPTWGAQFALVAALRRQRPGMASGLAFGTLVWASDYVTLALLGVYQPVWRYPLKALLEDLTAHQLFGLGTAAALRAIATASPETLGLGG
jgi:hypothetical protein